MKFTGIIWYIVHVSLPSIVRSHENSEKYKNFVHKQQLVGKKIQFGGSNTQVKNKTSSGS